MAQGCQEVCRGISSVIRPLVRWGNSIVDGSSIWLICTLNLDRLIRVLN